MARVHSNGDAAQRIGPAAKGLFGRSPAQLVPVCGLFKSHFHTAFAHDVVPGERRESVHVHACTDAVHHVEGGSVVAQAVAHLGIIEISLSQTPDNIILFAGIGVVIVNGLRGVDELSEIVSRATDGGCCGRSVGRDVGTGFAVGRGHVHSMAAIFAAVVENVGIKAVIAVVVGVLGVVDGAAAHAVFVNMVLGWCICSRDSGEGRGGRVAVEGVAELVGIVAVVGVLHL